MKINGLEVNKPITLLEEIIYACPYCSKKFLNKGSYYNHIKGKYCHNYFIDFEEKTQAYKNNEISADEYYDWCYEKGYLYMFEITPEEKEKISNRVFEKISKLYEEDY